MAALPTSATAGLVSINGRVDVSGALRSMQRLGGGRYARTATSQTINSAARQTRTESIKTVRQRLRALKARSVRRAYRLATAKPQYLRAVISASGKPIALREYGAKVVRPRGRNAKKKRALGVSVEVIPGKREMVKGAFVVDKYNGHIFKRAGRGRLPIYKLYGPSIGTAMENPQIDLVMTRKVIAVFPRLFAHNMQRQIKRAFGLSTRRRRRR